MISLLIIIWLKINKISLIKEIINQSYKIVGEYIKLKVSDQINNNWTIIMN